MLATQSVTSISKLKLLKQKRSYYPLAAAITLALSTRAWNFKKQWRAY